MTTLSPAIILNDGPFWDEHADAYIQTGEPGDWQRCKLGPYDLPGIVDVTAPMPRRKVDVKDADAKGGATTTIKGWSPSTVKITVRMWTP